MSQNNKRPSRSWPFLMVALFVNGLHFFLGALSDHSRGIIILYCVFALLNFLGSWKTGSCPYHLIHPGKSRLKFLVKIHE